MSLSGDFQYQANLALNNESGKNESNETLAPDRFLNACPIKNEPLFCSLFFVESILNSLYGFEDTIVAVYSSI